MAEAAQLGHVPTRADLDALPPGIKGEIIDGVLYTMPRPRAKHQLVTTAVCDAVFGPYHRARGGPGGWWILVEPGVELPAAPEIAPDLAAWRRERLVELPDDEPIRVVPDWICEVLSPSTRGYDRRVKLPFYARIGVRHAWVVDPDARTIEVKRLEGGRWLDVAVHGDDEVVRCEPFDAAEVGLSGLWAQSGAARSEP